MVEFGFHVKKRKKEKKKKKKKEKKSQKWVGRKKSEKRKKIKVEDGNKIIRSGVRTERTSVILFGCFCSANDSAFVQKKK